jgi:selenoprotein W-related protein
LAAEILGDRDIERYMAACHLFPTTGGLFEVSLNGRLLFSKKELGRHAEPNEIKPLVVKAMLEILLTLKKDNPNP